MKIYTEESLRNFEFWSGAKDTVKYLTDDELDTIEEMLEETYPEGMDETQINDIFWFEDDWIAEMLGYNDFEELMHRDDEEDEDEEEEEEEEEGDRCPECGKLLTLEDYETYYNEDSEDTAYYVMCSKCGYDELNK